MICAGAGTPRRPSGLPRVFWRYKHFRVGGAGLFWHAALRVVFFGALLFAVIAFFDFAVSPDGFLDGVRL